MSKLLIFAGTSEGRRLACELAERKIHSIVSVATEYGEDIMLAEGVKSDYITIRRGRMDKAEMISFIKSQNITLAVDATHPFATQVSENIKRACDECAIKFIRCLRDAPQNRESKNDSSVIYVNSLDEAVQYLNNSSGNIFVTTGSKELYELADKINDTDRLYVRVLPNTGAVGVCERAGIKGSKIYALQGPFDTATNRLMLRLSDAKFLLTKETGKAGGYYEKLEAAKQSGVICVVIKRPDEQGLSFEETLETVCRYINQDTDKENAGYNEKLCKKLTLVGIGMGGGHSQLTIEATKCLENAQIIFGSDRALKAVDWCGIKKVPFYAADKIIEYLSNHAEITNAAVAFSGDTGFYSGARSFFDMKNKDAAAEDWHIEVIPGITTVQAFAARLGIAWQDLTLCSVHGRKSSLISRLRFNDKLFCLASDSDDIRAISRKLIDYGFKDSVMHIAVNISYDDEQLYTGAPSDFLNFDRKGLISFIIERRIETPNRVYSLPDDFFERTKVPMTKQEVRAVSISKLRLTPDAVLYDIGAGTGSIAVECAGYLTKGEVYAVEKKEDAAELILKNARKAACDNISIVRGAAPQALEGLPAPTHAFIGGSGGSLREILDLLYAKNPKIRIVINAVTLETQNEIFRYIKEKSLDGAEIVTMQISRAENVSSYHMMRGENPVMIVTL